MTTTGCRSVVLSHFHPFLTDDAPTSLQRDASNFWIVGPRAHLELRSVIENAIRSAEGENQEIIEERFGELPQILFY
jgi:hypothetical protein